MIQAMKDLLHYYETGEGEEIKDNCALCTAASEIQEDSLFHTGICETICDPCSWRIFTDECCPDFVIGQVDISDARETRNEAWLKIRIPQLKQWIEHSIPSEET